MFPLGIQEGTCGIIGNCIGSNNVPLAKRFFDMITKFTLAVVVILCLMTYLARSNIVAFFTEDEDVQAICTQAFVLLSVMFFFDGM